LRAPGGGRGRSACYPRLAACGSGGALIGRLRRRRSLASGWFVESTRRGATEGRAAGVGKPLRDELGSSSRTAKRLGALALCESIVDVVGGEEAMPDGGGRCLPGKESRQWARACSRSKGRGNQGGYLVLKCPSENGLSSETWGREWLCDAQVSHQEGTGFEVMGEPRSACRVSWPGSMLWRLQVSSIECMGQPRRTRGWRGPPTT